MRMYTAVIERDQETKLEVVAMLLEDGEPTLSAEFVGAQPREVAWRQWAHPAGPHSADRQRHRA